MIATMLGLFRALPSSVKVGFASVLVLAGLSIKHGLEVRGLKAEIRRGVMARENAETERDIAKLSLEAMTVNRDALKNDITAQNAAIAALASRAVSAERAAGLAAVRVLRDGDRESRVLREEPARVAPGHEGMNAWIADRFR